MLTTQLDYELLHEVTAELDATAQVQEQSARDFRMRELFARRSRSRSSFRTDCQIRFLTEGAGGISETPGRTRNISTMGLGLLVRRVFAIGEPVEVELVLPGKPNMFLLGTVRFCRYIRQGYSEMGVILKATSPRSILTSNHIAAQQVLESL